MRPSPPKRAAKHIDTPATNLSATLSSSDGQLTGGSVEIAHALDVIEEDMLEAATESILARQGHAETHKYILSESSFRKLSVFELGAKAHGIQHAESLTVKRRWTEIIIRVREQSEDELGHQEKDSPPAPKAEFADKDNGTFECLFNVTTRAMPIPVSGSERAYQLWDTAKAGSSANYPCDVPAVKGESSDSTFENDSSDAWPPWVNDCNQIIQNIQDDGDTFWRSGMIGAKGDMQYNGNVKKQNDKMGIFYA
ncbi:hypothetical protein G7Z17_g5663 [Cylindrodendrum hubeiense]|uniref:Uncharacterized protein n=1 Tax=Cylindrodendrum hubeiense TaxID=595255 RepID=A0A9P5L8W4_9HYPO|nr:hypothetical protein G7Z17_g5663 [Cylindrodendrum hubeiense]